MDYEQRGLCVVFNVGYYLGATVGMPGSIRNRETIQMALLIWTRDIPHKYGLRTQRKTMRTNGVVLTTIFPLLLQFPPKAFALVAVVVVAFLVILLPKDYIGTLGDLMAAERRACVSC